MKRNFLTAVAVMVTAIFAGTTIAQATDFKFSGELQPRFESIGYADYDDRTAPTTMASTRARFNVAADVNPDVSAFLQLQSVGVWGADQNNNGTRAATGGAADQVSDQLGDVGFHQAYFTIKNVADTAVNAKVGRQEIILDGHRLLGNTVWTQGSQSHDAALLVHAHGNHTFLYAFSKGVETGAGVRAIMSGNNDNVNAQGAGDTSDFNSHVFWANFKGIMGGDVSLYAVGVDNDTDTTSGDFWTLGGRHVGKLAGLNYRVEAYKQIGSGGGAYVTGSSIDDAYTSKVADFDAEMFGIRVGKTFKNVTWSPTVTLWYDYLSGTDDDDIKNGRWGTFHTLFDTGHKFYGLIDNYLHAAGNNTANLGLQDVAIKFKIKPRDGWVAKADFHHFMTAVNPGAQANIYTNGSTALSGASDRDFGQEIDLTVAHNYNANVKVTAGYSHYWATQTFGDIQSRAKTTGSDDADWFYVNTKVKF